ncbi:hypothetical protein ACJMK2_003032 [Sinanodonta woodiana]|uniref:Uncharacterized protein n=1 Tax=Sinanodonta woodiana TaxID=1069815 RepID=A0ABD3XWZ5_SINWO
MDEENHQMEQRDDSRPYFRRQKGIIMAVGFDDPDALESLWTSFKSGKLNAALQEALLTPSIMHSVEASKIVLHTRLFEDEYTLCHDELYIQTSKRENVQSMHNDLTMIARIKEYQKFLNQDVMSVRDLENQMEHSLGEFMAVLKQVFPNTMTKLQNLQELETIIKDAQGTKFKQNGSLDLYIQLIERMNKLYQELYISVAIPLLQIHSVCENETQRKAKECIVEKIRYISKLLRSDTDLQKVSHPGWSVKVIKREEGLFLGLISLVPISVEHAYDIDLLIDEYMRQFPDR